MSQATLYSSKCVLVQSSKPDENLYPPSSVATISSAGDRLLVNFSEPNSGHRGKKVSSISIGFYVDSSTYGTFTVYGLTSAFDPETVTYNSKPGEAFNSAKSIGAVSTTTKVSIDLKPEYAAYYVDYGVSLYSYGAKFRTDMPISLIVTFSDEIGQFSLSALSPANGANIVPANAAVKFLWSVNTDYDTFGRAKQTQSVFRWRLKGSSSYKEVSGSSENYINVPASTFTSKEIEWQIVLYANTGATATSEWRSIVISDDISTAIAVSPVGTIIDGSVSNTFYWEHVISTGTPQTAFDLQTSSDQSKWETLYSQSSANTSVDIPANTFTAGLLFWRVRTYSTDGSAGEWSEAASVIVIAAPNSPTITVVRETPKFSIRWQQEGQQAFEVELDGNLIEKRFGSKSSYEYYDCLAAGTHTIRVRIQNEYGLWSQWASAALSITNLEGSPIHLNVIADNELILQWAATEQYDFFEIYRNGIKIQTLSQNDYADNFAVGSVTFQVRGVHSDTGNYTMSNTVSANVSVPCIMIASVNNPIWQKLNLSTGSLRSTSMSASRSVTYLHHVGAALPSAEIGEAVTMTYNLDCAFKTSDLEAAKAFEALLGQLVCIKEPGGERYVGVLDSLSKENVRRLYRSYTATITLVDWEEGAT